MRTTEKQEGPTCRFCNRPLLKDGTCCDGECVALEEIEDLERKVATLTARAESAERERDEAQKLVASMHSAAIGEIAGPHFGLVEDVVELRSREKALVGLITKIQRWLSQGSLSKYDLLYQEIMRAMCIPTPPVAGAGEGK
jgi:hypothetical protein